MSQKRNEPPVELDQDFTLEDVAAALRMSPRWVRGRIAAGAEHMRMGHKIRFTAAQVQKLRESLTTTEVPKSMTTGRKKKAS